MKPTDGDSQNLPAPDEFDALLSAISDGITALVAWDITAFQDASDRQRAICDRLAIHSEWRHQSNAVAGAKKVQELNRVYDRLLQHSIHWTRTIRSILDASGHSLQGRASMHFRG